MNEEKYKKYSNEITKYIKPYLNNKINILQLGCYNKEVVKIFLDNITNKKSKVVCIDTFIRDIKYKNEPDYDTFKKDFMHVINESGKEKQVDIIKLGINNGLIKLKKNKKYLFDIIFIDSSYEQQDILLKIILSWQLLNTDGILIFDNYGCKKIVEKELCPLFSLESFIKIYQYDIKILSSYLDFDKEFQKYFGKKNSSDNIDKNTNEQIVIKKIINKFEKINTDSIGMLFNKILNYKMPPDITLPSQKYVKLDWNLEYYKQQSYEFEYVQDYKSEKIYIFDDVITEPLFNKFLDYNYNRKTLKYLDLTVLDNNFFIHVKKYNLLYFIDYYIKNIKNIKNININVYKQLKEILNNYFIKNNKIKSVRYLEKYNILLNYKTKNKKINILRYGLSKDKTTSGNDLSIYLEKYLNKKVYLYQIYFKNNLNNLNNLNTNKCKFISNNLKSYDDIQKLIIFLKYKKIDYIELKIHIDNINININKLYELNYYYINYLYLILSVLSKNSNCCIFFFPIFNNVYYEIIYILSIYFENIKIKIMKYELLSIHTYLIYGINFKGINKFDLNNIKKLCKNISDNKKFDIKIKSLFKNKINNNFLKLLKKYDFEILKSKIIHFKNKYEFNNELSNLSDLSKKYYFFKLFEKNINIFYNYIIV